MSKFLKFLVFCLLLARVRSKISSNETFPNYESELPVEIEQFNDSVWSSKIDFEQFPGELCTRACIPGDQRICYFKFHLEHYQAMGSACRNCLKGDDTDCDRVQCILGDGFEKGVMSINRQIPGPAIQVCKNDRIIVDVVNMASGSAASIHWHGLHMRDTPWMDGVPFVTQCPIPFATTFRYQYIATEPGTQFYHSHSGHHKVNGQYGALIIRQPLEENKHADNYDFDLPEHYILISDWMHRYAEEFVPGLPSNGGIFPDSILINGRGSFIDHKSGERTSVPPTRYYVTYGSRYRFRVINSVSNACPVQIQVEGHQMVIISSDSYDVEPNPIDTLVTNAGERYDFVLEANQTEGDYWIRIRGLGTCTPTDSVALLRYVVNDTNGENFVSAALPELPSYSDVYQTGVLLNHPNASCTGGLNNQCITELSALETDVDLLNATPDFKFYLSFNNYPVDNKEIFRQGHYTHFMTLAQNTTLVAAINNLSLVFPDSPPLTQSENIDSSLFCDESNTPEHCLGEELCSCVHLLRVTLDSVVELVVVDESKRVGRMHHPFHLHGNAFLVTGLGQHPLGVPMTADLVKQMERQRSLPRNSISANPPWKDTVTIPSFGFAVFRFRAYNPGYWLMHCHYEWHLAIGMGLIVQVAENNEMIPPPTGFPKCGNYLPDLLPAL